MFSSARLVVLFSLLTQLAGFLKTLLIAYYFGASADLDGYYLALVLPSLVVGVLGGILQTGFIPVYMELLRNDQYQAGLLRNRIFTLLILVLFPLCIILSYFSDHVVGLYVVKADQSVLNATISAFSLVVFMIVLNAVADFLALTLNAHKHFYLAIVAPLGNMLIASLILILWPVVAQLALTVGLVAGVIFQLMVVIWGLGRMEMRPRFAWPRLDKHLRKVGSLAAVIVMGVIFANLNLVVDQVMAAFIGEGAVSLIGYANRFHNLIAQTMIMGVGVVLLPYLTELFLDKKYHIINELFIRLSSVLLFIGIFIPISVLLLGDALISLLLERGEFGNQEVTAVSTIWFWYSLGLAPMAWGIFLAKYYQAISYPKVITKLALISFLANIALNLLLIQIFGIYGLAIATSLVYLLTALLYHASFTRIAGFSFSGFRTRRIVAMVLASLFIIWGIRNSDVAGFEQMISIILGVLLVLVLALLLKIPQEIKHLRSHHE